MATTRLRAAAFALTRATGIDGWTLADVAAEAGIPAGSVFYHFRTKDAMVAGVAEYLPDELAWEYDREAPEQPWRVSGERVDATLTPFGVRRARTNALVIDSDTRQAFGVWHGFALRESGEKVVLDGIVGWAEDVQNRW